MSLLSSICAAFAPREHHSTDFFDLEKAYGTIWRHLISLSLYDFGLHGNLPILIQQFLSNWCLRVLIRNVLSVAHLLEGVPQVSILTVILFAWAINYVIGVLPEGILGSLYVDDLSVSVSASGLSLIE